MPTIGLVFTRAASAGFTILQACDLRLALSSSSLHTHFSYIPGSAETLTDATHVEAFVSWKESRLRVLRSHWERSVEAFSRRTGLAPEQARAVLERNRLMPAHEAFACGCLDGIV